MYAMQSGQKEQAKNAEGSSKGHGLLRLGQSIRRRFIKSLPSTVSGSLV